MAPDEDVRGPDSAPVTKRFIGVETVEQGGASGCGSARSREPEFTVARQAGRMAAGRLRAFIGDRLLRVVLRVMDVARVRRCQRVQRGADPARTAGRLDLAVR